MSGFSADELAAISDEGLVEAAPTSALNPLDSRWYELPEVAPMLVAYLRANPESVWEADD